MIHLGIDAGGYEVKTVGPKGTDKFLSCLGEYRERNIIQKHSDDDMIWEYNGHILKRGFAAALALHESDTACSVMGTTKLHEDALVRILLAIHRATDDTRLRVMVGTPITSHGRDKASIKAMVEGRHTITVNGHKKTFVIDRCEVALEGGVAFWGAPDYMGTVRIIDAGSGTFNLATLLDKRYKDRESTTLPYGGETGNVTTASMSRVVCAEAIKRWHPQDMVWVIGGAAEALAPYIQRVFPNATVFYPRHTACGVTRQLAPVFANAVGMYELGKKVFE